MREFREIFMHVQMRISSIRHCQHGVETSFQTLLVLSSFYGIFFTFDFFFITPLLCDDDAVSANRMALLCERFCACVCVCIWKLCCIHVVFIWFNSIHLFALTILRSSYVLFASSLLQTRSFADAIVRKYIFFNLFICEHHLYCLLLAFFSSLPCECPENFRLILCSQKNMHILVGRKRSSFLMSMIIFFYFN